VPDENSYSGARALLELAGTLTPRDIVFAGITGGSSALISDPIPGMTLQDKQRVHELLLLSGADIFQINAVRKHLSRIKGGQLAKAILPATLVNLTVSDVVGDALDYITDPTVPDTSHFEDARAVLDEFDLWDEFPPAAAQYLRAGSRERETPKSFDGLPLQSFLLVPGDAACVGAYERARVLGFESRILTTRLEGEAREAGKFLAAVGLEILQRGQPMSSPCAMIVGGENVVSIGSASRGQGGPNMECALAASLSMREADNMLIASLDTDGGDGPTDAAGGMVDSSTFRIARSKGLDPREALKQHDAYPLLRETGDLIRTGPTGTNVNDLKLLLVGAGADKPGSGYAERSS
jgi:hydroxypyruvate reductase/glycerate 2-kinase